MNAADCLCLSSRSEGMPNVVLEALASGTPVVATDVGACRDLLGAEPAARLVPPESPAALAQGLEALLAAPVDRPAMARRNASRFSWDRQARTILSLMRLLP